MKTKAARLAYDEPLYFEAHGDVQTMTRALRAYYEDGNEEYVESYSDAQSYTGAPVELFYELD